MKLITLTSMYDSKVLINADRIDGVVPYTSYTSVYVGGLEEPFRVMESIDEIKSMCEPYNGVTKYIGPKDSGPRLNIDEMY